MAQEHLQHWLVCCGHFLIPALPPLTVAQGVLVGPDEEGLLRLELKIMGLLQNPETWPKEDGSEAAQVDMNLCK